MHTILTAAMDKHYANADSELAANVPLLYYVQLALIAFLFVVLSVVIVFTPAKDVSAYLYITLFSFAVLSLTMYLNLSGHYRTGMVLTISVMFAAPWASVLFECFTRSGDFVPMIYVIIPLQIGALFFSTRVILSISAVQTLVLSLLIITCPTRNQYNWSSLICFIFLTSLLGSITSYVLRKQYLKILSSKNNLAESEKRLRDVSIRDPLSGLYNRRYMDETFQTLVLNTDCTFSLMMVDVDHFKRINDTYGHTCGDVIIQRVAEILTNSIRKNDVACRYGGDEFLLILLDCALEDTLAKARMVKQSIETTTEGLNMDQDFVVSASIGIAHFPENGNSRDAILKAVDDALYQAKQRGRNQIVVASGKYSAIGKEMLDTDGAQPPTDVPANES